MLGESFPLWLLASCQTSASTRSFVMCVTDSGFRYCASPFSGMGTTLGLTGAWTLAGCILEHPNDHKRAFDAYEAKMQPTVALAQKLAPGMPRSLHPATNWGVWLLNAFAWLMLSLKVFSLLMKMGAGPPAHFVPVDEFGFQQLDELVLEEAEKEAKRGKDID